MNMFMDIRHRYSTEQAMNIVMVTDISDQIHLLLKMTVEKCLLDCGQWLSR